MNNPTEEKEENIFENPDSFFISEELNGIVQYNFEQLQKQQEKSQYYKLNFSNIFGKNIELPVKFLEFSGNSSDNEEYKSGYKIYENKNRRIKLSYSRDVEVNDILFINKIFINLNESQKSITIIFYDYSFDFENKTITSKEFELRT